MANREISEGRKAIFVVGQVIAVLGLLSFGSVFVTAAMSFGTYEISNSTPLRAFGGAGLLVVGGVLMVVGRAGLAGSGVVLDPQRTREDLEPWSRMAGGMVKDVLDQSGVTIGTPATAEPDFADRLRKLHALHQEGILSDDEYAREKAEVLERN